MSFIDSVLSFIGDIFTKIWRWIKKILPYLLLALALCVAFMASPLTIPLLGLVIPPGWASAAIIAGVSYLLAPEETAALVSPAVKAIGNSAAEVIAAAGTVAGAGLSALSDASGLSTLIMWGALGVLAYLLLTADRKEEEQPPSKVAGRGSNWTSGMLNGLEAENV